MARERTELKNLKKKCPTFREFCEIKGLKEGDYYYVLDYIEYCDGLTSEQQIEITRKWLLKGVKTMNREILFRGVRPDNGEWVYGYLLEAVNCITDKKSTFIVEQDATYFGYGEFAGSFEVIPETIGQFTGLVDKNGNKIFEGDIIAKGFDRYEVRWNAEQMRWGTYLNDYELAGFTKFSEPFFEIIGNIYENKELLEVEK